MNTKITNLIYRSRSREWDARIQSCTNLSVHQDLVKERFCNLTIKSFPPTIIAFLPIQAIAANPVHGVEQDEADWVEGRGGNWFVSAQLYSVMGRLQTFSRIIRVRLAARQLPIFSLSRPALFKPHNLFVLQDSGTLYEVQLFLKASLARTLLSPFC